MKLNLQKLIVPPIYLTVLTYLVSFGMWVSTYYIYQYPYPMSGRIGTFAEGILPSSSLAAHLLSFGVVMLNSFLLAQMNNKHSFIRTRTFMPTFVYLLLSTCWLPVHGNYVANLAALLLLLVVFLTLGMYKNSQAMEQAFLSSFVLGLSTFLVPEFVYLIVLIWVGYFFLKCSSFRVFVASFLGLITPWILLLSTFYFLHDNLDYIYRIPTFLYKYSFFSHKNISTNIYFGILALIVVFSLFQMTANARRDSIQIRNELTFIKLVGFGVLMLSVLRFSNNISYLPTIAIFYAIIVAYAFTLIRNLFNSIVFIMLCVISFIFMFYRIILYNWIV